ncbi:hypothetical protein D3C72_1907540 [compost metagenome]
MVVLVFVDENPEELIQTCGLAVHCSAQVVITVDDFAVKFGAKSFLLNVPHAYGFQVSANTHAVQVDFEVRAHAYFKPGLFVKAEVAHLNGAARVLE